MTKLMLIRGQLFVRITGALGATALAVFFIGLIPFLGAEPSAGAAFVGTPEMSVNRQFKGDRLPLPSEINSAISRNGSQASDEIPVGCDASFSPVSSPRLAHIYGRCTT